ncbi:DUF402 domain-containing protein [Flindersiella endophytica]
MSFRLHKWDGTPHRQTPMAYLGRDGHGCWLGHVLTPADGPGRPGVTLIPRRGCYVAHFKQPPSLNWIYVDITTEPELGHDGAGWTATATDLDLDVVRREDGRVWIDDEDEFAEHAAGYGYPADVVAVSRSTADAVRIAVRDAAEPFGTTWRQWIDRLRA